MEKTGAGTSVSCWSSNVSFIEKTGADTSVSCWSGNVSFMERTGAGTNVLLLVQQFVICIKDRWLVQQCAIYKKGRW